MLPPPILLLCSLFALAAVGGPLQHARQVTPSDVQQRLLPADHNAHNIATSRAHKSNSHFDAAPNSVGILFTTSDDEEVSHLWLPLNKRVYTRKLRFETPGVCTQLTTTRVTRLSSLSILSLHGSRR